MNWRFVRGAALALACMLGGNSVAQAQWGTLKGQFVFDGEPPKPEALDANKDPEACKKKPLFNEELVVDAASKGLANVVLYCNDKKVKVNPAAVGPAVVKLDNSCCRFEPHILCLSLEQKLEILNSDVVGHNAAGTPLGDAAFNPLIAPGQSYTHQFMRAQRVPVPVKCSIHPWMTGWVLPRENPYFAVSDKDGKFEIKDLPAGKVEFRAWQEKCGYLDAMPDWKKGVFTVDIPAGGTKDLGVIKVSPKVFGL